MDAEKLSYAQQQVLFKAARQAGATHPTTYGLNNTTVKKLIRVGLVEWVGIESSKEFQYFFPIRPTKAGYAFLGMKVPSE